MAERKVAKLIALIEELRRDLTNVANRHDSFAEAMTEAIDTDAVTTAFRETIGAAERGASSGAAFAPHVRHVGSGSVADSAAGTRKKE